MNAVNAAVDLARLVLRFGQVRRVTMHPDGEFESDTTHTVMLSLLAMELAQETPDLNPGLVAQFALVHDLAEAYAGDVNTARGLSEQQKADKDAAEAEALTRVRRDLKGWRWLIPLIDMYERQECAEARFVRYVDKLAPKLTHILNGGQALRALGMTRAEVMQSHRRQGAELREEYPEFPALADLFDEMCLASELAIELEDERVAP